jgi:hypothetical protein
MAGKVETNVTILVSVESAQERHQSILPTKYRYVSPVQFWALATLLPANGVRALDSAMLFGIEVVIVGNQAFQPD